MQHEELTAKQKFLKNFASFLTSRGKILVILFSAIILFTIGAAVYSEVRSSISEKSTVLIENIENEYSSLGNSGKTDDEKKAAIDKIIIDLDNISSKYKGFYAAQRALFLKGEIFFAEKDFEKAEAAYSLFAEKYQKSYLAPIAINNRAVCLEETGNMDEAVESYKKIIDNYSEDYPDVPHVMFSLGRIYESKEDFKTAYEYYTAITDKYVNSDWTNLARNRIIYLKASGKYSS